MHLPTKVHARSERRESKGPTQPHQKSAELHSELPGAWGRLTNATALHPHFKTQNYKHLPPPFTKSRKLTTSTPPNANSATKPLLHQKLPNPYPIHISAPTTFPLHQRTTQRRIVDVQMPISFRTVRPATLRRIRIYPIQPDAPFVVPIHCILQIFIRAHRKHDDLVPGRHQFPNHIHRTGHLRPDHRVAVFDHRSVKINTDISHALKVCNYFFALTIKPYQIVHRYKYANPCPFASLFKAIERNNRPTFTFLCPDRIRNQPSTK